MTTSLCGRAASWAVKVLWQERWGPKFNKKRKILCRFHPSCSQYARLAFEKHGIVGGARLTVNRIGRCRADNCDTTIDFP